MRHSRVILIVGFVINSLTNLSAQQPINNPYQPPVFTQTSPEAAAFKRYGDVPVSLYTGVPDITIPLHTVKLKDMELPINLSYHAGGITVDQDATIVGLGWSLNVGGNITVSQVGGFGLPETIGGWSQWKKNIDYVANHTGGVVNVGREAPGHGWNCALEQVIPPDYLEGIDYAATMDMGELDVYRVSLPNRSFAFVIKPITGEIIFVGEKNKCKISRYMTNGFVITDEYGVRYFFALFEINNEYNAPTSWYLTRIADVFGNEIELIYKSSGISSLPKLSEVVRGYYPSFTPPRNLIYNSISTYLLSAIKTKTQKVTFNYGSGRRDIGQPYLKNISVIDSVNRSVKAYYKFNYNYFTSSTVGGDYLNDEIGSAPTPSDNKSLRLKLESLSQSNPSNLNDTLSHIFVYDERHLLPQKTSFAKDFWGYYNGQENTSTLYNYKHTSLPDPRVMKYLEPDFDNVPWDGYYANFDDLKFANRFTHRDYQSIGTLKSVIYPTGGRTEFEFESHDFRNQLMLEANDQNVVNGQKIILSVNDMNDPYGLSQTFRLFTLTETTGVRLGAAGDSSFNLSGGYVKVVNQSNGAVEVVYFGAKNRWDVKWTLPAGTYRLICDAPSSIPFQDYRTYIGATLSYQVYDRAAINELVSGTHGVGGGLRVKTIKNFDKNNKLVGTKEYSYKLENGLSSGRLLKKLDCFQTETITTGWADIDDSAWPIVAIINYLSQRVDAFNFFADNFLDVRNSTASVGIGYDRVVVRNTEGTKGLGEEISYFVNEPPMTISTYFSIYQNSINGTLTKKVVLDHNRDTVQTIENKYNISHYQRHMVNIKAVDTYYGQGGPCGMFYLLGSHNRYNIVVYAYTNFVNQLIKTEMYNYAGNTKIYNVTENKYDPTNYQLDEIKTLTSNNEYRISQFTYPHDYPTDFVYPKLVDDNIINPVIEQKEYLDSKLLKTQENKFWFWMDEYHAIRIAPSRVKISLGSSALEDKIIFDKYDPNGNLLQYHIPDQNVNTVFYRGYGDNRVVAKITGAMNYDLVSSSAGPYLNQLDDNLTKPQLESVNTTIRSLMPDALITTYTYDPLFGITSETDANGKSTYYEYDGLGRLILVRNHEGSILKQFNYNYYKDQSGQ